MSQLLPFDIVSEILSCCVGAAMDHDNTIATPLLLTRISQQWRYAALSTPKIWSRLFIKTNEANADLHARLARKWLERSGAYPLTIYVFWEEDTQSIAHPLLDAIIEHCDRWEHILLYIPINSYRALEPVRDRLPVLKHLTLGSGDSERSQEQFTMFANAPRLHTFECMNINPLKSLLLPWQQIQSIPIVSLSMTDAITLLQQSPLLESAALIVYSNGITPTGTQQVPFENAHLRSLFLHTDYPGRRDLVLEPFVRASRCPRLHSLRICDFYLLDPTGPGGALPHFLMHSPALQVLDLRQVLLPDDGMRDCLGAIPDLRCLIIHSADQRVLQGWCFALFVAAGGPYLVPKLTDLRMSTVISDFVMLIMIESRWRNPNESNGVAQLQHVELGVEATFLNRHTEYTIADLQAKGLDITVIKKDL